MSTKTVFEVKHGVDFTISYKADTSWGAFNIELIKYLYSTADGNEELFASLCTEAYLEDKHWEWVKKAVNYKSDEYEWFCFTSEGEIQGMCIFYHPKQSRLDQENIFYIEYLATAPWNRKNKLAPLKFKGIGTILLRESLNYSINHLGYRPGFSLHSLPKALSYYSQIGMQDFGPDPGYHNLNYFEMEPEDSKVFANG